MGGKFILLMCYRGFYEKISSNGGKGRKCIDVTHLWTRWSKVGTGKQWSPTVLSNSLLGKRIDSLVSMFYNVEHTGRDKGFH